MTEQEEIVEAMNKMFSEVRFTAPERINTSCVIYCPDLVAGKDFVTISEFVNAKMGRGEVIDESTEKAEDER